MFQWSVIFFHLTCMFTLWVISATSFEYFFILTSSVLLSTSSNGVSLEPLTLTSLWRTIWRTCLTGRRTSKVWRPGGETQRNYPGTDIVMVLGWCFHKLHGLFLGCLLTAKFCKNSIAKISAITFTYANTLIMYMNMKVYWHFFYIKSLIKR